MNISQGVAQRIISENREQLAFLDFIVVSKVFWI